MLAFLRAARTSPEWFTSRRGEVSAEVMMFVGGGALILGMVIAAYVYGLT